MPRTLSIARKWMSLKDRSQITDETGVVLYECIGKWGWFNPPWVLLKGNREVAVFRRKAWSLAPTSEVRSEAGDFRLRSKLFPFRQRIMVQGGPFDGAELTGSLSGMRFELARAGKMLAQARAKWLTMRGRHDIDLVNETPQGELLTAIVMASLLVQKSRGSTATQQHRYGYPHSWKG